MADAAWRRRALARALAATAAAATAGCGITEPEPAPAPRPVAVCAGVQADASGREPAAAGLQACIDATPDHEVLELPEGVYRIDRQLSIRRPMTLRSAGSEGRTDTCGPEAVGCAVLRAGPNLALEEATGHGGLLDVAGTSHVVLKHLVLDGNRRERLHSASARRCRAGLNRHGFNAAVRQASHVSFLHSSSVRALCGTGMEWWGDDAVVMHSLFQDNGDVTQTGLWADGLTLLHSRRALVAESRFVDNSDVGLISGGAPDGSFRDNVVVQRRQLAFAGIMTHNFFGTTSGDFSGAVFERNVVDCRPRLCNFGIQLGAHPWMPEAPPVLGGTVRGNTVRGGLLGINADGAGTHAHPVRVYGNVVEGVRPASVVCRTGRRLRTAAVNLAPDAVVDRGGESAPVASTPWHRCERFYPVPLGGALPYPGL